MSVLKVLFVCTGNICRSPTAEGVFMASAKAAGLARHVRADSAGTTDYHRGEPPDPRAAAAARRRGYDLSRLRARQVAPRDFEQFHYLLAMDASHLAWLRSRSPVEHRHKVRLLLDFAPHLEHREVPDPYYGANEGFDLVLDLIEQATHGLLDQIQHDLGRGRSQRPARTAEG